MTELPQQRRAEEYLLIIEALRGLAALLVIYAHYWKPAGIDARLSAFAFTGVDLFFVLSGFVFAPYFFGRNVDAFPFLIRRAFRIYPVYFCGVVVYWLMEGGIDGGLWSVLAKHLLFLHTWENYEIAFALNPPFWSLPPEVEFYLLLPLLAPVMRGTRRVVALLLLAVLARTLLSWLSPPEVGVVNQAFLLNFHLPGLLCEFLCGVVAWKLASTPLPPPIRLLVAASGMAGLIVAAWWFSIVGDAGIAANALTRGNVGLFAAICYAALVVWLGTIRVGGRTLSSLCKVAGALSFGLYIFHNAALSVVIERLGNGAVPTTIALGLSIVFAGTIFLTVEQPLRAFGRRLAQARQLQIRPLHS